VAGAEDGGGLAACDQLRRYLDGRLRLPPERCAWRFLHRNRFGGIDEPDARSIDIRVPRELGFENLDRTYQRDAEIEMPHGRERAVDDGTRRGVAAHRVNSYPDHHRSTFGVRRSSFAFEVRGSRFLVRGSSFGVRRSEWRRNREPERKTPNLERRTEPRTTNPERRTVVLLLFDRPGLAAAVVAAVGADAMR